MKKIFTLFLSCLTASVWAAPVDPSAALSQAQSFMKQHGIELRVKKSSFKAPRIGSHAPAKAAAYYVFNNSTGGFVVVSGDDRTRSILGYSTTGSLDEGKLPENTADWLNGYVRQIAYLDSAKIEIKPALRKSAAVRAAVSPFLQTLWNQSAPYNNDCPNWVRSDGSTERSVTGCVATAMAQVMGYYRYPSSTKADIPRFGNTYRFRRNGTVVDTTVYVEKTSAGSLIDWTNMQNEYGAQSTAEQRAAVAHLMAICGQSVRMQYANSSGAFTVDAATALREYFGYDEDLKLVNRKDYSYVDWNNLIYSEVAAKRPVLYGGQSNGGGHAFVFDGYDGNGLFHVNWGWGGHANGYFSLDILDPGSNSGIGASSTTDGYSMGQDAIIGIQKPDGERQQVVNKLTTTNLRVAGNRLHANFINWTGATRTFDYGFGVLEEDGSISHPYYLGGVYKTLEPNAGYGDLSAGTDFLPNGTFKVVSISREQGTDIISRTCDRNVYVLVEKTAAGTTLTLHQDAVAFAGSMRVEGYGTPGAKHRVNLTLRNTGDEYNGEISIFYTKDTAMVGTAVDPQQFRVGKIGVYLLPQQSGTYALDYTPADAGKYYFWASRSENGSGAIAATSINITAKATRNNGLVSRGFRIETQTNPAQLTGSRTVIGTKVRGVYYLNNPTDTDYKGMVQFIKWYPNKSGSWSGSYLIYGEQYIPAGQEIELPFEFDGSIDGQFIISSRQGDGTDVEYIWNNRFTLKSGIVQYMADGSMKAAEKATTMSVDADATAVSFRGVSGITAVQPNANPSTLYYFDEDAQIPTGLDDANVIRGAHADRIVLHDRSGVSIPYAFTAAEIQYRHTPVRYSSGTNGWETLILPFDVDAVSVEGGNDIDFFHASDDTGKQFWVKEFKEIDNDNNVVFDYAASILANTPYIMAFPGDRFDRYSLSGKTILFKASNKEIAANPTPNLYTDYYTMHGTMVNTAVQDAYTMNAEGNNFELNANATVSPFNAYFRLRVSRADAPARLRIVSAGSVTTDIDMVEQTADEPQTVYNLSGQQMGKVRMQELPAALKQLPKGVYIVNGKKYVVQ